ncbi:proclotting enzyme-like [Tachypleus tridentatus]|uniref:proclotting enzyme-like n=1 Tax=Tachypleus tridentatus TaxID=6853 RepID=UPI003FD15808
MNIRLIPVLVTLFFTKAGNNRCQASPTGPTCITTSYKGSCVAVRDCPQTSGISLDARVNSVCGEEKVCCPDELLSVCGKKKFQTHSLKKFKEARTANIQHWPWTAAVFYHVKGNPGIRSCGATLITARHLLTAATCVSYAGTARNFSILLGQNHIETQDSKKQEIFLESLITHENFEPLRFENDLAILKLERPVEYSDSISPVCLPYNLSTKNIDAKTAYITGWGQTTPGGEFSKNMQVLHVPTWNQKTVKTNMKIQRPLSKQCFVLVILKEELMLVCLQHLHKMQVRLVFRRGRTFRSLSSRVYEVRKHLYIFQNYFLMYRHNSQVFQAL